MTNDKHIKFQAILERHKILFDGELGLYPHEKFHLTLKVGAVPVHKKLYPVPHMDNINIWTKGLFNGHMVVVDQLLERLARGGMKCNPLKGK